MENWHNSPIRLKPVQFTLPLAPELPRKADLGLILEEYGFIPGWFRDDGATAMRNPSTDPLGPGIILQKGERRRTVYSEHGLREALRLKAKTAAG